MSRLCRSYRALRAAAVIAWLACMVGACQKRDAPYHFRAPLVSSMRADDRPGTPAASVEEPRRGGSELPAPHRDATRHTGQDATQGQGGRVSATTPGSGTDNLGVADAARAQVASGQGVAESLRAMVGQRDREHTHLQFAMNALAAIGVRLAPEVRDLATGADLVALARERDALEARAPLAGDLVVFDRIDGATPASLVGVVVGRPERDHATVEFVYLSRGVVRRGYVTPAAAARKRDDQGRALNTFVRELSGKAKKSDPFLAGQLFDTYIRVDRLPQ